MNQLGIADLSFYVDDIERGTNAIREAGGGSVLDQTRIQVGDPDNPVTVMFCTDPDGTRLEIVKV